MRPLDELKDIAMNYDWKKFLDGDDFREMVKEIERLRAREKGRLRAAVRDWKERIGRLDMLAEEIRNTPGAEYLILPGTWAARALTNLIHAMDQTLRD